MLIPLAGVSVRGMNVWVERTDFDADEVDRARDCLLDMAERSGFGMHLPIKSKLWRKPHKSVDACIDGGLAATFGPGVMEALSWEATQAIEKLLKECQKAGEQGHKLAELHYRIEVSSFSQGPR